MLYYGAAQIKLYWLIFHFKLVKRTEKLPAIIIIIIIIIIIVIIIIIIIIIIVIIIIILNYESHLMTDGDKIFGF